MGTSPLHIHELSVGGFQVSEIVYGARVVEQSSEEDASLRVIVRGECIESSFAATRQYAMSSLVFRPQHHDCFDQYGEDGATIVKIGIAADRLKQFQRLFNRTDRVIHVAGRREFANLAMAAAAELRGGDRELARVGVESLVLQIIKRAAELPCARGLTQRPPSWLDRAALLLHGGYAEEWTISRLADAVGVAPAHLAREFKRFYGRPVRDYLRHVRLENAARLLKTSTLSIANVAQLTGFCDQAHLANVFRDAFGLPPLSYRRSMR